MKISVLGYGRWGSFLAWYLSRIHAEVMIYGREVSATLPISTAIYRAVHEGADIAEEMAGLFLREQKEEF